MALLKNLIVQGASRFVGDTYLNNVYSQGLHHSDHDNNDSVLLAGGGYKSLTELDYLPLSGGTVTGLVTITSSGFNDQLIINRAANSVYGPCIGFSDRGTLLGTIGYYHSENYTGLYTWDPTTDQTYRIWNANNDGHGSGLDADLLDGNQGSYYASQQATLGIYNTIANNVVANESVLTNLACYNYSIANEDCTVKIYDCTNGSDYSLITTITDSDSNFAEGRYTSTPFYSSGYTNKKVKIEIIGASYIKAISVYLQTSDSTISTAITGICNGITTQIATFGSWHTISRYDVSNNTLIFELNTTYASNNIRINGFRILRTNVTGIIPGTAWNATTLTNTPELKISGNTIAVKAGEKTSSYITIPYSTKTGNISGGDGGSIPYQSSENTTSFLTGLSSNNGNVLTYDYTNRKPYWNKLYEANLNWGGQDITDGYSPIDAAMNPLLSANRFAGMNAAGVTVEYYDVTNSNWVDYGLSNGGKTRLFTSWEYVYIAGPNAATTLDTSPDNKLRITLDTNAGGIYTRLNKLHILVSTTGSQNVRLKIEYALRSDTNTYITFKEDIKLNGWSGWNVVDLNGLPIIGGSEAAYIKYLRFTFTHTGVTGNYAGLRVGRIYGYGGVGWTVPSTMASCGVPYTYDELGNIYIMNNLYAPDTITANNIVRRGSSNDYILLGGGGTTSLNSIDTKVTQTVTNSGNSSWRPLILGYSYNDSATFSPETVTNTVYASHLAKFAPSTGMLAVVGLNKMNSNGTMSTGSDTDVFNTNGGTTDISIKADKVSGATNNHLAALDANGNLKDSGIAAGNFLEKLTYEWSMTKNFGSTGYLLIGKFPMYDSNLTIEINSTTSTTYHAILVIATQNINTSRGGTYACNVYGDANNTATNSFIIQYSSGSRNFNVYFQPQTWSKNIVHIRASGLQSAPNESEICTSVSEVPTTDLLPVTNMLKENFVDTSMYSRDGTKSKIICDKLEISTPYIGNYIQINVVALTSEQKTAIFNETGITFDYCDTGGSINQYYTYCLYSDNAGQTKIGYVSVSKNTTIDGLSGTFFNLVSGTLETGTYYVRIEHMAIGNKSIRSYSTCAYGDFTHAEGNYSSAIGSNAHAEGQFSIATGGASHAEGMYNKAVGNSTHAEGYGSMAIGLYSHSEGRETIAVSNYSHTEGYKTKTKYAYAHAEGSNTTASGEASHSEGIYTTASGHYSHAEGYNTVASSDRSHVEGTGTTASNIHSHAEGYYSVASGQCSHAEGDSTTASGTRSHSEGYNTTARGSYSHAEGSNTFAGEDSAHAEGNKSLAIGDSSHAEGAGAFISGTCTKNGNVFTLSSGTWPYNPSAGDITCWTDDNVKKWAKVVSATNTTVTVDDGGSSSGSKDVTIYFHAAVGDKSHVGGWNNIALQNYQTVIGANSLKDTNNDYAFIVGNGSSSTARGNAFAVGWNGKLYHFNGSTPIEYGNAQWFTGTAVNGTGTNISATVSGSKAGDMYLNSNTQRVYIATAANTWDYVCNIKGEQGTPGSIVSTAYRFIGDGLHPCALKAGNLQDSIALRQADAHIIINNSDPNNQYADVHLTYHCFASALRWQGLMTELNLWRYNDWCGNITGSMVSASGKTEVNLPKPSETNPAYGTIVVSHNSAGVGGTESDVHLVIDMHLILTLDVDQADLFTDGHCFELEMA